MRKRMIGTVNVGSKEKVLNNTLYTSCIHCNVD